MKNRDKDSKIFAFLATFITIVGFVIAIIARRDDSYVMYYAKQGLVLFIFQLIVGFITSIAFLGYFLTIPLWIVFLVAWVWSWTNALSGEKKYVPVVSHFAEKINL